MNDMFEIFYNPEAPFNPSGKYRLDKKETRHEAIQAAEAYGQMYYGENSPIWVMDGRKKIHTVPAGRS